MTLAVVVQARMGSTRLPGKVLLPLGGITALAQCLRRCRAIPGADVVVCAVPDTAADQPVADAAAGAGAVVTRGPLADVLRRYLIAADAVAADTVMRITSDCPLIDPDVCGRLIGLFAASGADYAANNLPPSWPHGLDAEIFRASRLREADRLATAPADREHVTPWLRRTAGLKRANLPCDRGGLAALRWTLDYPEDYRFLAALFELLPPPPAIPPLDAVLATLAAHPELEEINRARRDPSRPAAAT